MSPEARDHGCEQDSWALDHVTGEMYCTECRHLISDIEADKINAAMERLGEMTQGQMDAEENRAFERQR